MVRLWKLVTLTLFVSIAQAQENGTCPLGFLGPRCALCEANAACALSTNVEKATCSTDLNFLETSTIKSFACDPTGPSLVVDLLVPDSLIIQCHTRPGEEAAGAPAPAPASPPPAVVLDTPPPLIPPVAAPAPAPAGFQGAPVPSLLPLAPAQAPTAFPPVFAPGIGGGVAPSPAPGVIINGVDISGLLDDAGNALGGGRRLRQAVPAPEGSADASANPYCEIGFKVKDPAVEILCMSTDCGVQPGSPNITCAKTTCSCAGDPTCANNALITSLAQLVNGMSKLKCQDAFPNGTAACGLILEGLPLPEIQANCRSAECIVPSEDIFNGTNTTISGTSVPNQYVNPIIAAIPLFFIIFVVAFVGGYTWIHREMWTVPPADQIAAAAPAATAAHHKNVGILEFKDICVKVPMNSSTSAKKHAALRHKALARHPSTHILVTPSSSSRARSIIPKKARSTFGIKDPDDINGKLTQDEVATAIAATNSSELSAAAEFVSDLHGGLGEGSWTIVKECSGVAAAGEVVGVLGPSGCGKTTLLGAIAGSALDLGSTAVLEGTVLVDGAPRRGQQVAYVSQADNLIPTLTVAECIRYSALLRLPRNTPLPEVHARVALVLEELGLRHVADAPVGGAGRIRGISGGERRRVSIGMELVTDPSIIVLDEPTSGLDSFTAINLIRSLRQVAVGGRVVIASLHQPSKDMFYALDRVILMGHGRMLLSGRPEEAEGILEAAGVPCPKDTAIAEYMLKVASSPEDIMAVLKAQEKIGVALTSSSAVTTPVVPGGLVRPSSAESPGADTNKQVSANSESAMAEMEAASPSDQCLVGLENNTSSGSFVGAVEVQPPRSVGWARQLSIMFWRTYVDIVRNPTLLKLHIFIGVVVGVIIGVIFHKFEPTSSGVQNRMGSTFFALAFLAFTSLTTVDLLMNERDVVMREVRSGYYEPAAYLLSKLTLDGLLLRAIPAILLWIPFYYIAGFRTGSVYASLYVFALVAFNCCVGALSMAITIGSNTAGQAAYVLNFTLLFMLAFTGFLVNVSTITPVLRWIHYLSPFFYVFESVTASEVKGLRVTIEVPVPSTGKDLKFENVPATYITSSLGLREDNITLNLGILVGLYGAFMLMSLVLFYWKMPKTRKGKGRRIAAAGETNAKN